MSNIELKRDHEGALHLFVGGHFANGARVTGVQTIDGDLAAVVVVPLKIATLGEVTNVIPFVRPPS